jgi:hypothetical protein
MKAGLINISLLVILFVIFGCKKDLELEFPDPEKQMVVDGYIEQNSVAQVLLSYTSPYFGNIDSSNIREYIITTAKVTISDGEQEEVLTLYKDEEFFPPYVYKSIYIKGEVGKSYKLTVNFQGKEYTAETTIPEPSYLTDFLFDTEEEGDTLGILNASLWDIPNENNYYRVYTRRWNKNEIFTPSYNCAAISDNILNKGDWSDIAIYKGVTNYYNPLGDIKHDTRDTIEIKLCSMDKISYDCLLAVQKEILNYANPFAEGNSVSTTNINGGIGVWSGFGVQKYVFYPHLK